MKIRFQKNLDCLSSKISSKIYEDPEKLEPETVSPPKKVGSKRKKCET
jgi:hypothetical protein